MLYLPFFCEEPTLFTPYVGFVFPQLWVSFSPPAVCPQLSRTITQQSSVSCVLEMRVEKTNAVQVAKNVTTATVEPSGNWYLWLWFCVSACQNARSTWFPSKSATRGCCCCSRCCKWGGMCVPRCPHQRRYGIRHYTGTRHSLCQPPCRQPVDQQPSPYVCAQSTHLMRIK